MTLMRRRIYRARRVAARWSGVAAGVGFAVLVGAGWLDGLRIRAGSPFRIAVLAVLIVMTLGALSRRLFQPGVRRSLPRLPRLPEPEELELGLLLVAGTEGLIDLTGGGGSPLYALAYVLVAFVASLHRFAVGVPLVVVVMALEWARYGRGEDLASTLVRAAFLALFGALHLAFLHGEVFRARRNHRKALDEEIRSMREDARDFRLIGSMLPPESRVEGRTDGPTELGSDGAGARQQEEDKLARGAVETIHEALHHTLGLLQASLGLRTVVLLWLDESGATLKVKELVTESDFVTAREIPAHAGAPGAIVKDKIKLSLLGPKAGYLPYYGGPEDIGAFLGVPILEDPHLRGVLCVDRTEGRAFDPREEALVLSAARQVLRIVRSERVFAAVERSKYEMERFFGASALLNEALGLEQVCDAAFRAAGGVAELDFAAITLFRKEDKKHLVVRASGSAAPLAGEVFGQGASLVSMVVKNQHYVPAGGVLRDRDVPIFGGALARRAPACESLLVLPLNLAGEAIGTFVIGSEKKGVYGASARELLGVIANHVAVSVQNANHYQQMEMLATTDGLTGLVNHRTFQERASLMLERALRHGRKCVLLLTDIDHFKKVNDTYGHPTGDLVLKGVAAVVSRTVRKIDLAARYGGEEFAVLLDEIDGKEARKLAERIRNEVKEQVFPSDKGQFKVTLSIGMAVFPDDGADKTALIAHADQALYGAKHGGRDRVVAWEDMGKSKATAA